MKSSMLLQLNEFSQAMVPLNHALSLDTNNYSSLLLRGIAYLGAERLDDAQNDFETLKKTFPKLIQVSYGLAQVADRKKDTNLAVQYYEACISEGGTNTLQGQSSFQRLIQLKGGKL
jgi:tetratricopeptide (TPR) repeat protein